MMNMKPAFFSLAILFMASMAGAVQLAWNIPLNERLEITRTARVSYYLNTRLNRVYDERNIIDLTCLGTENRESRVKGVFSVFTRESGGSVFRATDRYDVDFSIHPRGNFIVHEKSYMPNLRSVPTFPDRELKEGDTWSAQGELVLNNFSRAFKLIFPVEYTLSEMQTRAGSRVAVIKYRYLIGMDLAGGGYPADFPAKIAGQNDGVLHWDVTQNQPVEGKDMYRIVFVFGERRTGYTTHELRMNIETTNKLYAPVTEKEKEKAKEEINRAIPGGSGIDVESDARGLVLRMGEVLFDFDSFALRPDTRSTLEKISAILRDTYPDREIIVEGHTDDTGSHNYNQKLSTDRARTVAEFLKGRLGHDKFSFRGFGPDRPLADNASKEGRGKNRRVEIIIKLH